MRNKRSDSGKPKVIINFCELYNLYVVQRKSMKDTGVIVGASIASVKSNLIFRGIKIRGANETKRGNNSHVSWMRDIDMSEAEALYNLPFWNVKRVANHFGLSPAAMRKRFNKAGIPKKKITEIRDFTKEKHPRWDFNKTDEQRVNQRSDPEIKKWREAVYLRDGYSCVKCGDSKGGNLNAHHISPYWSHTELRTDVNNGVTLCVRCHKRFHREYGIKRFSKEDFEEFMK